MAYERLQVTRHEARFETDIEGSPVFIINVPSMAEPRARGEFARKCTKAAREACARAAMCSAEVNVVSTSPADAHDPNRQLRDGYITCYNDTCPLDASQDPSNGGTAGDREPRTPLPELPVLYAEAELPV